MIWFDPPKNKVVDAVAGVLLAIVIANHRPPAGLTVDSMIGLGILVGAVIFWIFEVLPEYVVALMMCTAWAGFGIVPFKVAFATFSSDSWWLLLAALGLGVAATKSGVIFRISLYMLRWFPPNFCGQILALLSMGTVISPLIPSNTAKAAVFAPISLTVSDAMGFPRKSRGAGGLFAAMYIGALSTGPLFLSASFMGYTLRGLLPFEIQAQFNWFYWFACSQVWGAFLFVASYLIIVKFYQPEQKSELQKCFIEKQFLQLTPLSRCEKITIFILSVTLILWICEPLHNIPAVLVALMSLVGLISSGVIDQSTFCREISWHSLIFIGGIISIGTVLPYLKIDVWIANVFGELIVPLLNNIYVFIIVLAVFIYFIRFLLVSMTATLIIFTGLLTPFSLQMGINPWVVGMIIYCSINVWNTFYQNSTFLVAYYSTGGQMVSHKQMIKMSFSYMIISLIGLLLSVPLWKIIGLVR